VVTGSSFALSFFAAMAKVLAILAFYRTFQLTVILAFAGVAGPLLLAVDILP